MNCSFSLEPASLLCFEVLHNIIRMPACKATQYHEVACLYGKKSLHAKPLADLHDNSTLLSALS